MRSIWGVVVLVALVGCGPGGESTTTSCSSFDAGGAGTEVVDAAYDVASLEDGGPAAVFDSPGPAEWTEAGWQSAAYDVGGSVSITGSSGSDTVACDGADELLAAGSGCVVNGGIVVSALPFASEEGGVLNAWRCVGAPAVSTKGATIVVWAACHRSSGDE